ncbi:MULTISPECIES: filamentous hemagglutinin N-terminal domain-containing protein [Pseudomonas]|uniref:filamentous hemagglutinin N-terminal domain-containing protein n=1 Tax=Pseudomonas TaxID=286 RepID=UPI001C0A937B|nr:MULTISPECIES: filamentous hemagglutinin N-terminal domain-containing protein [Pseudomonas]MCK3840331.1 filamentous hemagglutinin N-terminal domain-containing protein [Pseudomonas sp. NCIMB 10586]VCU62953.1 Hemolysin [Pseudomonas synxantha]
MNPMIQPTRRPSKRTLLALALMGSLPLLQHNAQAQPALTLDPSAAQNAALSQINDTPVVNIVAANAAGVSHNRFTEFNVGASGLILNNSTAGAQTTLGGAIAANSLLNGTSASVILNEVTGKTASSLNGMIEVAGPSARVIIANPNGITASGAGFINANRVSLVAGTAALDANGQVAQLQTDHGQIRVEGSGLDASGANEVDLVARTLQINAQLQAKKLNAVALKGEVDATAPTTVLKHLGADGQADIAIDVAQLGSMHADSIRLLGKSAGVGVNVQGNVKALTGDLKVTADGKVQIASTGVLDAKQALSIAGDLSNQGVLRNGGPLSLVGNIDIQGPIHFGGTAGSVNNLKPGTIVTGGAASTGAQNGIGVVINRPVASRPSYVVAPPVWSKPVVSYPAFNWSAYPSFAFNTATGLKQPTRILPQPRYW